MFFRRRDNGARELITRRCDEIWARRARFRGRRRYQKKVPGAELTNKGSALAPRMQMNRRSVLICGPRSAAPSGECQRECIRANRHVNRESSPSSPPPTPLALALALFLLEEVVTCDSRRPNKRRRLGWERGLLLSLHCLFDPDFRPSWSTLINFRTILRI